MAEEIEDLEEIDIWGDGDLDVLEEESKDSEEEIEAIINNSQEDEKEDNQEDDDNKSDAKEEDENDEDDEDTKDNDTKDNDAKDDKDDKDTKEKEKESVEEHLKSVRQRVLAQKKAKADYENSLNREEDLHSYSEAEFADAMAFRFSDYEADVDGEKIKISEIAKNNPEISALIKDAIYQQTKGNSYRVNEIEGKMARREKWDYIEKSHPGARDLGSDDKFNKWLSEQDDDVKELSRSAEADDLILVLDVWKKYNKPVEKKTTARERVKAGILSKESKTKVKNIKPSADSEEAQIDAIWGK